MTVTVCEHAWGRVVSNFPWLQVLGFLAVPVVLKAVKVLKIGGFVRRKLSNSWSGRWSTASSGGSAGRSPESSSRRSPRWSVSVAGDRGRRAAGRSPLVGSSLAGLAGLSDGGARAVGGLGGAEIRRAGAVAATGSAPAGGALGGGRQGHESVAVPAPGRGGSGDRAGRVRVSADDAAGGLGGRLGPGLPDLGVPDLPGVGPDGVPVEHDTGSDGGADRVAVVKPVDKRKPVLTRTYGEYVRLVIGLGIAGFAIAVFVTGALYLVSHGAANTLPIPLPVFPGIGVVGAGIGLAIIFAVAGAGVFRPRAVPGTGERSSRPPVGGHFWTGDHGVLGSNGDVG